MSVADEFSRFRIAYNVSAEQAGIISLRYRRITRQLNWDFRSLDSEAQNSLYVGSYGRDTAASGVSDIDIAFILPPDLYGRYHAYVGNGQSALLQAVRNSIQRTYPLTAIAGDGQVVKTTFSDGMQFEVLPVFNNTSGTWTFADSNGGGSWQTCNPRAEIAAINAMNGATNKNLKYLCRMMRKWKAYWDVPIPGMLIDTLAYGFISSWGHRDKSFVYHDYMARDFFAYLMGQADQAYWRAPGSTSYVYPAGNFRPKARLAYNLAVEAIAHDQAKRDWSRRQKWREVFGPSYPST